MPFHPSFSVFLPTAQHRPIKPQPARRKALLRLELLEDRTTPAHTPAWVPDEVLVTFQPNTPPEARQQAWDSVNATVIETIQTQTMLETGAPPIDHLRLATPSVDQALATLSANPAVLLAEPNYKLERLALANDPSYLYGQLWATHGNTLLNNSPLSPFGTQADKVWDAGHVGSKSVYIGLIDQGYDYSHPELADAAAVNPGEVPNDYIDNDHNGYVDDVQGWDFFHNDSSVYHGMEDIHGTHVAGTIGARGGNAQGVAGVNWNVSFLSAKFMGPQGGYTADAVKAVDYITDLKTRHHLNIVATNNSWGGGGYSPALHAAIIRAANAGILFITAAGNDAEDNDAHDHFPADYSSLVGTATQPPAAYENVIAVAATNARGERSGYSNYGRLSVDLGAPGDNIVSTTPEGTYSYGSGTSMATAQVTGAVALYASVYPDATAPQIRQALLASVTPEPTLAYTVSRGRLNAWSMLNSPPPGTPPMASVADCAVLEGQAGTATLHFQVTLDRPAEGWGASFLWAVTDGTATLADNDYQPSSGTLVFANGESSKTISITVDSDTAFESLEKLTLTLASPQNAVLFRAQATGSILNDDEHPNTTLPMAGPFTLTGPGASGGGVVKVFHADGTLRRSLTPYGPGYKGSIRVAQGDVNGDGVADLITAPGPGAPPHVMVFDGVTLGQITSYYAFAPGYLGGVNLSAGDLDCDGRDEVIAAAGPGAPPNVVLFQGATGLTLYSFYAYAPQYLGGVMVASGDVTGDGYADVVTASGPGVPPHVVVFEGYSARVVSSFYAYSPKFMGGLTLAAADLNADGRAEVITGAGPGGGPHVVVIDGNTAATLRSFYAFDPSFSGGMAVAATKGRGASPPNGSASILAGTLTQAGLVRCFDFDTLQTLADFTAYEGAAGLYLSGR